MSGVKFGDVVKEVKVNIDRSHNPYEFYVAGDHMDSEDLTIRRKGRFATDDVGPAFIRLFKPGQVLYGSRRTYLKKVAVADFEGITANTTFVLETKDENVFLQKLLPFLMLSDSFTEWSVKKSKGSTNPYVLFSDLADYEFNLPSLEEQHKLADLLWAAYDLKESYKRLLATSDELAKSRFVEMFGDPESNTKDFPTVPLGCLFKIGSSKRVLQSEQVGHGVPFLRISDLALRIEGLSAPASLFISEEKYAELQRDGYVPVPGDVLITSRGTLGRCYIIQSNDRFYFQDGMISWLSNRSESITNTYLISLFQQPGFTKQIDRMLAGSTVNYLSIAMLKNLQIVLPPLALQNEFAAFIEQLDKSKKALQKSIDNIDTLVKSLLNTIKSENTK